MTFALLPWRMRDWRLLVLIVMTAAWLLILATIIKTAPAEEPTSDHSVLVKPPKPPASPASPVPIELRPIAVIRVPVDGHNTGAVVSAIAVSQKLLAVGCDDHSVQIFDRTTHKRLHLCQGHDGWVKAVCFCQDGAFLLSGGNDPFICLWDVQSGKCVDKFLVPGGKVCCICCCGDDSFATGDTANNIRVFSISTRKLTHVLKGHEGTVTALRFSGGKLYSGSFDTTIRAWSFSPIN